MQTLRVNSSRTLRIKNANFSGYCFYMNLNIKWNFQTYISVPLNIIKAHILNIKDFSSAAKYIYIRWCKSREITIIM